MPVTGIFQPDPLWSTMAAALVLIIPGWVLFSYLPAASGSRFDLLSHLADAAALSVALSALLGLVLFLAGAHLNGWSLAGLYAICGLAGLVQALRRGWRDISALGVLAGLLALGLLVVFVAWRFYQARSLVLPAWVDSVHHVLVVRAIYENGGVPATLAPYLPTPFYYHYGFHLIAALFAYWARLSPEQAVLWLGQVINALVALSVYRLGMAVFPDEPQHGWLGRRVSRALLAALLVNFVFQMPAYYLSWGRYTLLTGLLVLGPAMAAAVDLYRDPGDRGAAIRLGLLLAGLCVAHYLALLLMLLFLLVLGLGGVLRALRGRNWRAFPWILPASSLLGLLLASPWLWRVVMYNLATARARLNLPEAGGAEGLAEWGKSLNYLLLLLGPNYSHIVFILSTVGLLLAIRRRELRSLVAWSGLLLLLDLPFGLRLGPFRPDHYTIVLFFPASLFLADGVLSGGVALGQVLRGPVWRWSLGVVLGSILALAAGFGLVGWGVRETRNVVNSTTNFVTTADMAALDWVKTNTPPAARFYINSILWQGPVYRGVDGGYWLLPYAGRGSLVPPSFYILSDQQGYAQEINAWAQKAAGLKGCTPDFWDLVRQARLTHLYLREGVGNLQPEQLAGCSRLNLVYQYAGVYIYEVPVP